MTIVISFEDSGVVAVQVAAYHLLVEDTQQFTEEILLQTAQAIIVDGGDHLDTLVHYGLITLLNHGGVEKVEPATSEPPVYQLTEEGVRQAKETYDLHRRG